MKKSDEIHSVANPICKRHFGWEKWGGGEPVRETSGPLLRRRVDPRGEGVPLLRLGRSPLPEVLEGEEGSSTTWICCQAKKGTQISIQIKQNRNTHDRYFEVKRE